MYLATNTICKTRYTRQARQPKIAQILNKAIRPILLIAFTSAIAACSGVPLIPGI